MSYRNVLPGILTTAVTAALITISCHLFDPDKNQNSNGDDNNTSDTSVTQNADTAKENTDRPDGWEFASHDKDAPADYNTLFPDNVVNRIDITISDSAWKSLVDDMTSMSGTFGAGGMGSIPGGGMQGGPDTSGMGGPGNMQQPGFGDTTGMKNPGGFPPNGQDSTGQNPGNPFQGGQIPQEFYDAAKDKQPGDSCSCTMMGMSIKGIVDTTGGKAFCKPQMGNDFPGIDTNGGNMGGMDNLEMLPREPVYIPVTVELNGKKWTKVGFRLKGNSSLIMAWGQGVYKLPFRIKTDEFEKLYPEINNQRMYGFKNLSLCNGNMDNTLVHEKVACDLFRSNDVPAVKSTFIRLYIDYGQGKKYFGLYTMDETPDAPFLQKWFSNKKGNLYKPDGTGAKFATFDATSFEELNNKDNSLTDIKALYDALHSDRSNAASWRSKLENVFDVNGFLKWLAINSAIGNWDAYGSMAHNYYLYNNKGVLTWIPWDLGLSFSGSGGMGQFPGNGAAGDATSSLTHSNTTSTWPLIRFLLDDPVYHEKYLDELTKFSNSYFKSGTAASKIQAAHDLIAPYVTGADAEQTGYTFLTSPSDFESAFTSNFQFITKQSALIDSVTGSSR